MYVIYNSMCTYVYEKKNIPQIISYILINLVHNRVFYRLIYSLIYLIMHKLMIIIKKIWIYSTLNNFYLFLFFEKKELGTQLYTKLSCLLWLSTVQIIKVVWWLSTRIFSSHFLFYFFLRTVLRCWQCLV